jgi:hypothetical protein
MPRNIINVLIYHFHKLLGPEIGTSSIDWAQLNKFHLKTESSLRNAVCL